MSSRVIQINEMLRAEVAGIISREVYLDNGLITVTKVRCGADLREASVFVSVLPENVSGTALKLLRQNTSVVSKQLRKLHLKYIPKITWRIDSQERFAVGVEKAIGELGENESE
jgi:ribosome-binding factor A